MIVGVGTPRKLPSLRPEHRPAPREAYAAVSSIGSTNDGRAIGGAECA
jgi:hypothetical protein